MAMLCNPQGMRGETMAGENAGMSAFAGFAAIWDAGFQLNSAEQA
jgi:hypothetical protein